jgi:hypothetical protein
MQHENLLLTGACKRAHADTRSDAYIEKSFGGKHMHELHGREKIRVFEPNILQLRFIKMRAHVPIGGSWGTYSFEI